MNIQPFYAVFSVTSPYSGKYAVVFGKGVGDCKQNIRKWFNTEADIRKEKPEDYEHLATVTDVVGPADSDLLARAFLQTVY